MLYVFVTQQVDGREDARITIKGVGDRESVVVRGSGEQSRVVQLHNDYYTLQVCFLRLTVHRGILRDRHNLESVSDMKIRAAVLFTHYITVGFICYDDVETPHLLVVYTPGI